LATAEALTKEEIQTLNPIPMKSLRYLLALIFAGALALSAHAGDSKDKTDKPKDEKACDCAKDKDGKACGVDKDCCCTGEKAKPADKKDETKPVEKK
jgi:hypothetical protein